MLTICPPALLLWFVGSISLTGCGPVYRTQ